MSRPFCRKTFLLQGIFASLPAQSVRLSQLALWTRNSGAVASETEQLRAHFKTLFERFGSPGSALEFTPGQLGPISGEWTRHARAAPGRVILYFHGGGYIAGSPESHRPLIGRLAEAGEAAAFA